ncbi:hypothetical protein IIE26_27515 (plasmid) [Cytobacillus oceanisediminis]|uniref:hypothetical protein n=1 Tax=Cytobacillus oceanisediminis TaxID=665099 RepID=UPI0018652615|nr:hypothetical protein [Cytobacillus oceanisediminis]QOK29878.1 hypothetical protein IIE26_27515 [Cytobacillus oceanisediminis]
MTINIPKILVPILLILIGITVTNLLNDWQAFLFPTIILIFMLFACFGWMKNRGVINNNESLRFVPVLLIILYSFSLPFVGIWISTLLFVVILQVFLDKRLKVINLASSIIFGSLLIFLFQELLAITFPAGTLWN